MPETERLAEVSPTMMAAIRRCGLAVHLSRTHRRHAGGWLSNPSARLGGAAHRVLGWVSAGGCTELGSSELEVAVRQRWRDEVIVEEKGAAASPVESYFGPAPSWPGYATTEERLVIEAGWLAAELSGSPDTERWVERPLTSSAPPMRGSPDLVVLSDDGARIVEFKSGAVGPEDAQPFGRYGLQVLMYAAMVHQLGVPIAGAEIRPMGRARLTVEVTEGAIEQACEAVTAALEAFNSAVDAGETWRLAQPSDDACGYCPHILRCPEIWAQGGTKELDELEVLEGTVKRVQQAQVGSVALELDATGGTRLGVVTITGLDPRRLRAATDLHPGEQVRVSGLRSRPGGTGLVARPGSWVQLAPVASGATDA
jgi:hypothetical protein